MSESYEHIVSRGAYGEIGNSVYERMRERHREIWFGEDGAGLISEAFIRSTFFNEEQKARWAGARNRLAREDPRPSIDLFAPGCLPGRERTLDKLLGDPGAIALHLKASRRPLHEVAQSMGEALVPEELRHLLYRAASDLPGVQAVDNARDELGRVGRGLTREERGRRIELVFSDDAMELLGERELLLEAADYAPANSLIGWTSYLTRETASSLPAGTPPIPSPPCAHLGAGRGTPIDQKFVLGTGHFTDLDAQVQIWLEQGVINQAQSESIKAQASRPS